MKKIIPLVIILITFLQCKKEDNFTIANNQGSGISIYNNSMGTIPTFLSGKIMFNNIA